MKELIIQNNTDCEVKLRLDSGRIATVAKRSDHGFQIVLQLPTDFKGDSIVIESIE